MTTTARTDVRPKEFHFPVDVEWIGERRVAAHVDGKQPIEITPPPEFRGTDPSTWSPEDFFVAAAASCLAVTFTGLAQRSELTFTTLTVDADGVAGKREDGRFGFTRLALELHVEVDPADRELARELAQKSKETCLVTVSFDLPTDAVIDVRSAVV
jgi:organic hydroperoxide reductase OsmC/OhrA